MTAIRQAFNVRDYGALGDGLHDDAAAINAAIAQASGGGEILFPPGVYLISSAMGLDGAEYDTSSPTLPPVVEKVRFTGLGGRDAVVIKSEDAFPAAAGIFQGCTLSDMTLDANDNGTSAANLHLDHTTLQRIRFRGQGSTYTPQPWDPIAGCLLNEGTYGAWGTGYLNRVLYSTVELPHLQDEGDMESRLECFGFKVGYRFSDSVGVGNYTEATEAGLWIEGSGHRWFLNHFNGGYARHCIQITGGCDHSSFNSNICELAREEAVKITFDNQPWISAPMFLNFADNKFNNGSRDDPYEYAAMYVQGKNSSEKAIGLNIVNNIFASPSGDAGWKQAVHLKWCDEFNISANSWAITMTEDPITLEACGGTFDVAMNGGRNDVTTI